MRQKGTAPRRDGPGHLCQRDHARGPERDRTGQRHRQSAGPGHSHARLHRGGAAAAAHTGGARLAGGRRVFPLYRPPRHHRPARSGGPVAGTVRHQRGRRTGADHQRHAERPQSHPLGALQRRGPDSSGPVHLRQLHRAGKYAEHHPGAGGGATAAACPPPSWSGCCARCR